ncbi:ParM/StbA family protein [Alkalinema pantanalense CENA528]|uniref:ParM/StbA family protein n=1 Tax=Alkalinema pantanalense TaxID=1620705 RepID=UPI003D6E62DA
MARSKDDAWLQCGPGEQCQVIGYLARQFLATVRMNEVKYERALYKVLAAVGTIAQETNLPRKFSIALSALLPYGEYQNAQRFQQLLKQHLKHYRFRGERLQVKLETFECRPEGGGLAMARVTQKGAEWFQQQTLAVLMFGHRNTSLLLFERGKLAIGNTTDLGFHQLVDKVLHRTSGQTIDVLTSAIYKIGNRITPTNLKIQDLLKTRSPTEQELEREQITTAILTAREEYWSRLQDWLDTVLPNATEVIISGGGAFYLHDELETYFNRIPTYWGTDLQQQLQEKLGLDYRSNHLDIEALSFRMVDVFGLYCDFVEQLAEVA